MYFQNVENISIDFFEGGTKMKIHEILPGTFLYDEPNLHWKLGQQTPSVGTLLAYLETTT